MTLILLIVQTILAVCLVLIILLQRNSSEGWSGMASSGSGTGVVSKRSSNSFFTRTTAIIAALFMINSIVLGNLVSRGNQSKSILEQSESTKAKKLEVEKDSSVPMAE